MLLLYEDFIYLLRDIARRWPWWISFEGEIRSETWLGEEVDPLTALAAERLHLLVDVGSYRDAARLLGLDSDTADIIAQAADLRESYNAHVRADLLEALRLSEQWGRRGRWGDAAFDHPSWPHNYDQPIRHGSGSGGSVDAATKPVASRFTAKPPSAVSAWRPPVNTGSVVAALSIQSACCGTPPASSSSFSAAACPAGSAAAASAGGTD